MEPHRVHPHIEALELQRRSPTSVLVDDDYHPFPLLACCCRVEVEEGEDSAAGVSLSLQGATTAAFVLEQIQEAFLNRDHHSSTSYQTRTVLVLRICFHEDLTQSVTQLELTHLLESIVCHFPHLERVLFEGPPRRDFLADDDENEDDLLTTNYHHTTTGELFLRTLAAALLPKASTLTHLHLDTLDLNGSVSDFFHFAHTIQSLKALESVDLGISAYVQLPTPEETRLYLLDPFVSALSTLPHLRKIILHGYEALGCLYNSTLVQLGQMSTLQTLHLISFDLTDENVSHLALAMQGHPHLTELQLGCALDEHGNAALGRLLRSNTSSLEELSLYIHEPDAVDLTGLFEGLGHSRTLARLGLYTHPLNSASRQALRRALQTNLTLESVDLCTGQNDTVLDQEVEYYTALNGIGRGRLLAPLPPSSSPKHNGRAQSQDPTLHTWFSLLIRCKDYPIFSYYFLSLNPAALCCLPATILEDVGSSSVGGGRQATAKKVGLFHDGEAHAKGEMYTQVRKRRRLQI